MTELEDASTDREPKGPEPLASIRFGGSTRASGHAFDKNISFTRPSCYESDYRRYVGGPKGPCGKDVAYFDGYDAEGYVHCQIHDVKN